MSWSRFKSWCYQHDDLGVSLDLSRLPIPDSLPAEMAPLFERAFRDIDALEKGAIANPDENRMVGHYWLRHPSLAPEPVIERGINDTIARIETFAKNVHSGKIAPAAGRFDHLLLVGIGGSALGPQFVAHALGQPESDRMIVHFLDNTDPDGFDYTLRQIGEALARTLVIVTSKSGGTAETRNGMFETQAAFRQAGLEFPRHAVAVTGTDSRLERHAEDEGWLERFPMWDWVGGRTSELGPVGLLPAALQGIDIRTVLAGAAAMDAETRKPVLRENPAALLALAWYFAADGRGSRDMVVLPYKDRLLLFSRYLQQLVMESLGKELDLDGIPVHQGLSVYGNKGSTDQHAYVQQLRDGLNNFFVTFIEVLRDRNGPSTEVEPGVTAGDYLQGFLLGTREALSEKNRWSITLTLKNLGPREIGMLIALYERVVGIYASLIRINAYHQPGVEAGKKAAGEIIALKRRVAETLVRNTDNPLTAEAVARALGESDRTEIVFRILERLAANPEYRIRRIPGPFWHEASYRYSPVDGQAPNSNHH